MTKEDQERLAEIYSKEALKKIWQIKQRTRNMAPGVMEFHTLDEIVAAGEYAHERLGGRKEPFDPEIDLISKLRLDAN